VRLTRNRSSVAAVGTFCGKRQLRAIHLGGVACLARTTRARRVRLERKLSLLDIDAQGPSGPERPVEAPRVPGGVVGRAFRSG
jgi:hypothetical protein